jgi:hypothetical protein
MPAALRYTDTAARGAEEKKNESDVYLADDKSGR